MHSKTKQETLDKKYSYDLKLFMSLWFSLFILFPLAGLGIITVFNEIIILSSLSALLVIFSIRYRTKKKWKWSGVSFQDKLKAVLALFAGCTIIVVLTVNRLPINHPMGFIFYAAIVFLTLFNVMHALRIVSVEQYKFDNQCSSLSRFNIELDPTKRLPRWKRKFRYIIFTYGAFVWIAGALYFGYSGYIFHHGSNIKTEYFSERITEKTSARYITKRKYRIYTILQLFFFTQVPLVLIIILIMHFFLGIPLLHTN